MALILCIETGTEICSVALVKGGELLSIKESTLGREHAKNLGVFVDEVLKGAGVISSDLDAVAVSSGPGSYTGLRIGVSLAKALCYALEIPLISVGSLLSLVSVALDKCNGEFDAENTVFCPMIDARRMEVYTQMFNSEGQALNSPEAHVLTEDSFKDILSKGKTLVVFGDGAKKSLDILTSGDVRYIDVAPSATGLSGAAQRAFDASEVVDTAYFEPLYLKDFMIHKSKKKFF